VTVADRARVDRVALATLSSVIGKDRMQFATPGDDWLPLLLEICEDCFAHIGPNGYYEVDALLRGHDITGGPDWLIDMLALTADASRAGLEPPHIDHGETLRPGPRRDAYLGPVSTTKAS